MPTEASIGNVYGIVFTGFTSPNPPTAVTGFFSNNLVTGCTVNNGNSSIRITGNSLLDAADNIISNNSFMNTSVMQVYITNTGGTKILNNTIASTSSVIVNYAIDVIGAGPSAANFFEISGNKINEFVLYGIFGSGVNGGSPTSLRSRIANNFFGGSLASASTRGLIWLTGTNNCDVWFNTCNFNVLTTTAGFGAFVSDGACTSLDVRDNIFAYTGSGASNAGLPFVTTTPLTEFVALDDNIFYNATSTNEASIEGTNYTNTTVLNNNYGGATTFNTNSQVINPTFVSPTDLHITVQCMRGVQIPAITTDIDNQSRLNPPNIGADEIPVSLGPPLVVTPNNAVCTGTINSVLVASGATAYTWAPTTNLTPSNGTSATETVQISALTIYTVTGTGTNGCTDNVQVPVATVAVGGTISAPFTIICSGGTKALSVSGAAGNDYQWQISADNSTWTIITGATNTSYTTASADGNTNKFYRLLANSNACWNVASTTAEVDVSNPVIAVTASSITDNNLILNWSPTGSGNYNITYSGASSGLLTGVTPPKTVTGLTADGAYSIVVTQTGLTGCSVAGTVSVSTLCAVPTNLTATPLTVGVTQELNVSWNGPAGNYRVFYRPLYSAVTFYTKDVTNATSTILSKQGNNNLYGSNTYQVYVSRLDCPNTGNVGQPTSSIYVTTNPTTVAGCATPTIDTVFSTCPVELEVQLHGGSGVYNVYIQRLTPTLQAVNSYGITGGDFVINAAAGQQYLISADSKCGSVVSTLNIWHNTLTVKPTCTSPANLVLSNPTCHGFTASWNADQCISNTVSGYDLYMRQTGSINFNSYGVALSVAPVGPHELVNWLSGGKNMQVFVQSVYSCGGAVTYGPSSQTVTITTQSAGCRDEEPTDQLQENKPAVQQYSADNQEVFSIYPNPNTGEFTVDLSRLSNNTDEVRIEVINMIGQTLITHIASISDGHMSEFINLPSGIAAGTYIVRLTAGKNVYTAKVNISK